MAVGEGRGGTARERHPRVLGGAHVGALDVQVAVDEAGGEVAPAAVDDLGGLVAGGAVGLAVTEEHAHDETVLHRHLAGDHPKPVDVHDLRVDEQLVRGHAALGSVDDGAKLLG